MSQKFCKDCKHYVSGNGMLKWDTCSHPYFVKSEVNLVTGTQEFYAPVQCVTARYESWVCGLEGKLYESA